MPLSPRTLLVMLQLLLSLMLTLLACTHPPATDSPAPQDNVIDTVDADPDDDDIEEVPEDTAGLVNVTDADPFDPNTTYTWSLDISDQQVDIINAAGTSSYYGVDTHIYGYADALTVTTLDERSSVVFLKPEVQIGGEMNWCVLPCKAQILTDLDQYTDGQSMGGYDNIKLGNMLYGGPYAEFFMYNVYFPAQGVNSPRAAYAWFLPSYLSYLPLDYLVMEQTKEDYMDRVYGPGNWLMAYEGYGDIGSGSWNYPSCQAGDCDDTVLEEIETDLNASIENNSVIDFLDRRYLGGHERFFAYCSAEKMVGQWDGYCDAAHNYTLIVVANPDDPTHPFIDLVEHSLDLALNPDWAYGGYGIFGYGYLMQACNADEVCATDYVAFLKAKNAEWGANVSAYEAQLDAQDDYLTSIGMQYDDYPGRLASNKAFIEGQEQVITDLIFAYENPCLSPDTGFYRGGGGFGWDTGGGGCSDTGSADTGTADTGSGSDTGSAVDTAPPPIDSGDTAAIDTGM